MFGKPAWVMLVYFLLMMSQPLVGISWNRTWERGEKTGVRRWGGGHGHPGIPLCLALKVFPQGKHCNLTEFRALDKSMSSVLTVVHGTVQLTESRHRPEEKS